MQIAVYWTNPNEGVLGVVHALRAMGIPFFVTPMTSCQIFRTLFRWDSLFEEDSGLYEFPVTIDDSDSPPLTQRVEQALEVVRANAENGAPNVILIHTNESQGKLLAEEALLRGLPPGVVATDMESFARFWRARDRLRWTAHTAKDPSSMDLDVTSDEAIDGLTIEFQREIADLKGNAKLLPDRRRILLPSLESGGHIHIHIHFHS